MKSADMEELQLLVDNLELHHKHHIIKYIPGKKFTIRHQKHSYSFYDLAQFYEMSLEKAAALYVNGVKNEDNLDREAIGSSAAYWLRHDPEILDYCIQDCRLTQQLGARLQADVGSALKLSVKSYTSKAGLSKAYFRTRCDIPNFVSVPKFAHYFAFQAYHGGRFEVFERGKIGKCTNIDINSAYPYHSADLIDITKGRWERVTELHERAYYGFYMATVDIPYHPMPPLALYWFGTNIYPCGRWTAYFTKEELEALDGIGSYEVIAGAEFYPDELVYPFRDAIVNLYDKKKTTPEDDYAYALYKKILNSFYGCNYEKIKQPSGMWKTGILFNPVYATLITANTRLQIWREGMKHLKRVISMATDGILLRGNVSYPKTDALGEWDVDKSGEAYVLRSGIYSVGEEMKQRGVVKGKYFRTPVGDYENLFDYIREYPEQKKYPVLNNRPIHMREAVRHTKKLSMKDINLFTEHELAFDLNTEIKRIFDVTDITGGNLLDSNIKSRPYMFNPYD
jgi:hypothetical protein